MTNSDPRAGDGIDKQKVEEFLQTESGGRAATGSAAIILFGVPLLWSLFQLWIASPLPYIFEFGVLNSTESRSIHLAFASFLAFAAFPMIRGKQTNKVPIYDWLLALELQGQPHIFTFSMINWQVAQDPLIHRILWSLWRAWFCCWRPHAARWACR